MKFHIVLFAILLLTAACSKIAKDENAPVIGALHLNATEFLPGDLIKVDVTVSDDENLNQIRVNISPAFAKSFGDWKSLQVREISGTSYQGSFSFTVPDTARSGYYQIAIQAADLRGNGTKDSILYFTINQPGFAPEIINFQTDPPIVSDIIYMTGQDSLSFSGVLADDTGLKQITLDLRSTQDLRIKLLTYNIPDSLTSWDLALHADTIAPAYQEKYPGSLLIKVLDKDGNQTRLDVPVSYTP